MLFKNEFNKLFKSGDKLLVSVPKYDNSTRVLEIYRNEKLTKNYTIGRTDLDTAQGQVELFYGSSSMVVEYQWFNSELTGRSIKIINK